MSAVPFLRLVPEGRGGAAPAAAHHFPYVVGRHSDCDFRPDDQMVSRRHCAFTLRDGRVWVEDLGSRNGTRLNGEPLDEALPLEDGDRLELGLLTFRVRLAGEPAAAARAEEVPAAAEGGEGRKVLVVEDDEEMAQTLAFLLESWGHRVQVVSDGPEAIRVAKEAAPEVVLLDIGLPGMSGVEVARQLRSDPGLRHARLVAVTGDEGATEVLSSRGQFEQFLLKPVSPRVLKEALGQTG
jgi:CheY-like chemotaxis protein